MPLNQGVNHRPQHRVSYSLSQTALDVRHQREREWMPVERPSWRNSMALECDRRQRCQRGYCFWRCIPQQGFACCTHQQGSVRDVTEQSKRGHDDVEVELGEEEVTMVWRVEALARDWSRAERLGRTGEIWSGDGKGEVQFEEIGRSRRLDRRNWRSAIRTLYDNMSGRIERMVPVELFGSWIRTVLPGFSNDNLTLRWSGNCLEIECDLSFENAASWKLMGWFWIGSKGREIHCRRLKSSWAGL